MPEEIQNIQTPINLIDKFNTEEKVEVQKSSSNVLLKKIIIGIGGLFLVLSILVFNPWGPIQFSKSEYKASNIEVLRNEIPWYVKWGFKPGEKDWSVLNIAEKLEGIESVEYIFNPIRADIPSEIRAEIILKQPETYNELNNIFTAAILKAGLKPGSVTPGFESGGVGFCDGPNLSLHFQGSNGSTHATLFLFEVANCKV